MYLHLILLRKLVWIVYLRGHLRKMPGSSEKGCLPPWLLREGTCWKWTEGLLGTENLPTLLCYRPLQHQLTLVCNNGAENCSWPILVIKSRHCQSPKKDEQQKAYWIDGTTLGATLAAESGKCSNSRSCHRLDRCLFEKVCFKTAHLRSLAVSVWISYPLEVSQKIMYKFSQKHQWKGTWACALA